MEDMGDRVCSEGRLVDSYLKRNEIRTVQLDFNFYFFPLCVAKLCGEEPVPVF